MSLASVSNMRLCLDVVRVLVGSIIQASCSLLGSTIS